MKIRVPQQENDSEEGVGRDWVEHPFTKRLLASSIKEREASLSRLLSACKASADPKVVAYVAEHAHCCAVADLCAGKWKDEP